ncbi:hypothetical protein [Terrabacter carboxydivorans]|uniref:hypothetical protein n=1 Tax=Terrabacter carboxydivorans TaxID=619730 RepID=UPI0031D25932
MATPTRVAEPLLADDVDARFVEIVCGDDDLLAAEFEAIIAASWPPPATPPPGGAEGDPADGRPAARGQPAPRARWVPSSSPRRERSPPEPTRTRP